MQKCEYYNINTNINAEIRILQHKYKYQCRNTTITTEIQTLLQKCEYYNRITNFNAEMQILQQKYKY